ncbi:helix-turn-helix domain-containing protein [Thermoflavimicrobium dichotomicum]|uniref:Helix-turn-helix domain-containing protein n=1 Tax=Thermoflavimicrobium dichotomicum TaxID=46223 RepID=A0A1I3PSM5_9BACL|nr:helix-turn-helix domain-containing protein [Thermoflavimicrobium dichotomicum]SFJ24618.1 Helix-turn-helix domain-containing protein [Thermoflavimicrobium dichotomicum]
MSVEIGSFLRQTREQIGLSLDEVQEKTKIQKSFLIAIENGEFHKLPSPFYVRTYLRSYANCLRIEPQHILRQYRKQEQEERFLNKGIHGSNRLMQSTARHIPVNQGSFSDTGSTRTQSHAGMNKTRRISRQTALTVASGQNQYKPKRANRFATQQFNPSLIEQSIQEQAIAKELTAPGFERRKENSIPPSPIQKKNENINQTSVFTREKTRMSLRPQNQGQMEMSASFSASKRQTAPGQAVGANTDPGRDLRRDTGQGKRQVSKSFVKTKPEPSQTIPPEVENRAESDERPFPTRGRRGKTKRRQGPGKRLTMVFIATAVCIPLVLLSYYLLFKDDKNQTGQAQENKSAVSQNHPDSSNPPPPKASGGAVGQVKLLDAATNKYVLENGTELQIRIEATTGSSWINIRNQYEYSKTDYVKDVTLKQGDAPLEMQYSFDENPELYIQVANPKNVKVYLNNEPIKVAGLIQITKK